MDWKVGNGEALGRTQTGLLGRQDYQGTKPEEVNLQDMNIPGEISLGQVWTVGDQLGSGGFGKVFKAHDESGQQAAIKFIPKLRGTQRELSFEELDGVTNVMPVLDRGECEDYWVLVMPLAEKTLREYLNERGGQLTATDALPILVDVVGALVAVENRVVHRDIKPENILLLNGRWHLADFGIARYADAATASDTLKLAKTAAYAAPEQWLEERATSATDVYAFGVVTYELVAGKLPFERPDFPDFREQHLQNSPGTISGVPDSLRSLVMACLLKVPEARPRPQGLLARLNNSLRPASPGGQLLQQANSLSVELQTEHQRQLSAARVESERRGRLLEGAEQVLEVVLGLFDEEIMAYAPTAQAQPNRNGKAWRLNAARLLVKHTKKMDAESENRMPFEVIAYTTITLAIPEDQHGYSGRSHSLWYCDAQEKGVFRWYETAFFNWLSTNRVEPFALFPTDQDAWQALTALHTYQVARAFTPMDQGEEGDFVERWMTWFGTAAKGELRRPREMPESNPSASWRREG